MGPSPGWRHLTLLVSCVVLLHHVHVADGAISISAAAASGANFALGGLPGGMVGENERDQNAEALIMLLMCAAVGGVVLVGLIYFAYKLIRCAENKYREILVALLKVFNCQIIIQIVIWFNMTLTSVDTDWTLKAL